MPLINVHQLLEMVLPVAVQRCAEIGTQRALAEMRPRVGFVMHHETLQPFEPGIVARIGEQVDRRHRLARIRGEDRPCAPGSSRTEMIPFR